MEIYKFFNSKDVAEYLKKINYQFNPLEISWIIWHSTKATIKEKHNAWRELIETTEDVEIPERTSRIPGHDSLHGFLKKYMDAENAIIERFMEKNGIYQYTYYSDYQKDYFREGAHYLDYEKCISDALNNEDLDKNEPNTSIKIYKQYFDEENKIYKGGHEASVNYNGELLSVGIININGLDGKMLYTFFAMRFDIPVPFKKGDIVVDSIMPRNGYYFVGPFVINEIYSIADDESLNGPVDIYRNVSGYYVNEYGDIYTYAYFNSFDLEYYKEPLKDTYRTLKCISSYLKEKISLEEVLRYYHSILTKVNNDIYNQYLRFPKENLKFGGLIDNK